MSFETPRSASCYTETPDEASISPLTFRSYIEPSIGGYIVLPLTAHGFRCGHVGDYLESNRLTVDDLELRRLRNPDRMDDQLVGG